MLAPRRSIASAYLRGLRHVFPRLGFSLRLNLWYAAFFICGAFLLFALAYVLLVRELRESDHEIVRAKIEACKAWYAQGGIAALRDHFQSETDMERDTTFLELVTNSVLGNQRHLIFAPKGDDGSIILSSLTKNGEIPDNRLAEPDQIVGEALVWTIGRIRLPDGSIMQVGRTTEDRDELLSHFRTSFYSASCRCGFRFWRRGVFDLSRARADPRASSERCGRSSRRATCARGCPGRKPRTRSTSW